MGNNESLPPLPEKNPYFIHVGQNAERIPYYVRQGHPVVSLNLQKNCIRELPSFLPKLKTLILSENNIEEISNEMKDAMQTYPLLTSLDIARNHLKKFDVSIQSLENLNIMQNSLIELPPFSPALKVLNADFNEIKSLNHSSQTLTLLTLSLNYITQIDPNITLPALEVLDLSMNRVREINCLYNAFPSLKKLNLSFNMFTEIPIITSPPLTELDLSNNTLTELPKTLAGLNTLTYLNVSHNKLQELPKLSPSIVKFIASHNFISSIEESSMPNLEELDLTYNQLADIPPIKDYAVTFLDLSFNHLTALNPQLLVRTLLKIDLSYNHLKELPVELFKLPRLRLLAVNHNEIEAIPAQLSESKIAHLYICDNPISYLPPLPPTSELISAAFCKLTDISECFRNTPNIRKVNFSGNTLHALPEFTKCKTIILSQCHLREFPAIGTGAVVIDVSRNEIEKVPKELPCINLTQLDISYNYLTNMPNMLKFEKLTSLNIAGNLVLEEKPYLNGIAALDYFNYDGTKIKYDELPSTLRFVLSSDNCKCDEHSAYAQSNGDQQFQEDTIIIRDDLGMYLLCDGHDGLVASTYVAKELPKYIEQPHEFGGNFIEETFELIVGNLRNMHLKGGASMVFVEIHSDHQQMITGHLGDSRAMVIKHDGTVKIMTKDHVPTSRKEFERIMKAGGRVADRKTNGILDISRSIGDFDTIGISSEPEINHIMIDGDDHYLVLASGSVFKYMEAEEVAKLVSTAIDPIDAAFKIKNHVIARGNIDNISVIVVPL